MPDGPGLGAVAEPPVAPMSCLGAAAEGLGDLGPGRTVGKGTSDGQFPFVGQRVEHHRHRYRRSCSCEASASPVLILAPTPAKVIPKGLFNAFAIASLLVDKFALARPVNKIIASLSM
ncbi:MAG: hypothetical protein ACYDEY_16295 [Acidimicrobiales bacterium]